jgi:glycine oxidase
LTQAVHRSAAPSIAIVGGGIIGLSIAWRLAQRGFSVSVYEKGLVGGEASWAGAGMLSPGGEIDQPSELATLALESRRLYPSFVAELEGASGLSIDFRQAGALDLAYSDQEHAALESRAARQSGMGIESKPVPPLKVAPFWPRVRIDSLAGARFYPGDALVNPRDVIIALSAVCKRIGVQIHQNCAVERASLNDSVRLNTANGIERHDVLVIAAGAWSGTISIDSIALPQSEPVKGHLVGYQQPEHTCPTIIRHGHLYLLQRSSGLLIVGASVEHAGFDRSIEPLIAAQLSAQGGFVMPHLLETMPTEIWAGFRPASDALHIGQWHSERLYLAYGHYRNGILLAPVTAERIASQISASWQTRPFASGESHR